MHDVIAVVHEDPVGVIVAFDAQRHFTSLFQLDSDLVADGLALAWVRSGADDEVVGEGGEFPKVEDPDIGRFLGFRGPDGSQPCQGFSREAIRRRFRGEVGWSFALRSAQ